MFSNFKNKLQVATHSMKEKMGRTDATIETEDTRLMKQNFKTIKRAYKHINHSGKSYVMESEKLTLITSELADSFLFLSNSTFSTTPLGQGLASLANQLKSISSVSQNYVSATNTNFVSPITKTLDVDIKRTNDWYKRQESARMKYDMALSQVKKGGSGRAAEELEINRQTYEQLTRELTEVTSNVLAQIGNELIYELKNWTESQARFYAEMNQMYSQISSQLEGLPATSQVSTTSSVINAFVPLTPTTESYISNIQSSYPQSTLNTQSGYPQSTYQSGYQTNTQSGYPQSTLNTQSGYPQITYQASYPPAGTQTTYAHQNKINPTLITVPEVITSTTTPVKQLDQQGSLSLQKEYQESTESPFAFNEPIAQPKAANPYI